MWLLSTNMTLSSYFLLCGEVSCRSDSTSYVVTAGPRVTSDAKGVLIHGKYGKKQKQIKTKKNEKKEQVQKNKKTKKKGKLKKNKKKEKKRCDSAQEALEPTRLVPQDAPKVTKDHRNPSGWEAAGRWGLVAAVARALLLACCFCFCSCLHDGLVKRVLVCIKH